MSDIGIMVTSVIDNLRYKEPLPWNGMSDVEVMITSVIGDLKAMLRREPTQDEVGRKRFFQRID